MSQDPQEEQDEQPEGNYLFWAILGTALVIAAGSTALLRKMVERPDLATADPLLVGVLQWARRLATLALAVMGGLLTWQFLRRDKNS